MVLDGPGPLPGSVLPLRALYIQIKYTYLVTDLQGKLSKSSIMCYNIKRDAAISPGFVPGDIICFA